MKDIPLPPAVYAMLAILKTEQVCTLPGIADTMELSEEEATKIMEALLVFGWAHEQLLFDGSHEYVPSERGELVLAQAPTKYTPEGNQIVPPPVFKETHYEQSTLF
jgi:hypothetical protein